jgi:peptidyl-prolyl cis-trans isomerase A (cyclophilin A)
MEVAKKIYDVQLNPTRGEGFLKGQMIETPVKILTVRRIPLPAPVTTPTARPTPQP